MFNNVIICGAGAIGANILLNLVRDLPTVNYHIIDFDQVAERNFIVGTQPFVKSDIKKYKVQALKMMVYNQCGKTIKTSCTKIESNKEFLKLISDTTMDDDITLVIDAFDNAESRNLINVKDGSVDVVHIGFSPKMTGSIIWDESWVGMEITKNKDNQTDVCTLEGARSFVMAFTAISSLNILDFYKDGIKKNIYFDKNNLKVLR